mgnify:CR=1 FL=1
MRSWYTLSKSSKWGLAIAVSFMPSFWGHEFRNQSDIVSLWFTVGFCRLNLLSTIYPKSRLCTKRHKMLYFQVFSGVFEGFSRKAEKGNCKYRHPFCESVQDFHANVVSPTFWDGATSAKAFSLTSAMPYLMVDKINPYSNQYRFLLDNARFKCYNYTVSKKTQFRCIIYSQ